MSTAPLPPGLTIEEYLSYQAPEGFRDELIDGAIILSPEPKPRHEDICKSLYLLLRDHVRGSGYIVRERVNMRLDKHNSMPSPDVFVIDRARWNAAISEDCYPEGSPELTIEVFSSSNKRRQFQRKLDLYLQTGSLAVWMVYPETRTVRVHDATGIRDFTSTEQLQLPAPLPSVSIAVADLFTPPD